MTGIDAKDPSSSGGGITARDSLRQSQSADSAIEGGSSNSSDIIEEQLIRNVAENIAEEEFKPKFRNLYKQFARQESRFENRVSNIEKQLDDVVTSGKNNPEEVAKIVTTQINKSFTLTGIGLSIVCTFLSIIFMSPLLFVVSLIATMFLSYSYNNSPEYK